VTDPLGLLRTLGSIGRAVFGPANGARAPSEAEAGRFEELLRRAESGLLRTDRGVEIAPESGLELSEEQLGRLGAAVDRAQAAGASRAAVLMDGRAFVVDVQSRRVLSEMGGEADALTGVDAVVRAPSGDEMEADAGLDRARVELPHRPTLGASPSLLELLQRSERGGERKSA